MSKFFKVSNTAILSLSQDTLFTHQYLRVTLKSVSVFSGFILKAIDEDNAEENGRYCILLKSKCFLV